MKSRECGICKFYQTSKDSINNGVCKCNPPTVIVRDTIIKFAVKSHWPTVSKYDWCGKFAVIH